MYGRPSYNAVVRTAVQRRGQPWQREARQIHHTSNVCWKMRFKTEVCTCSQFPTEAMLWIKEVELVDSVDGGIQIPKVEVLDARIASALNRIILISHFKRRVSVEEMKAQKRGPFPSWKTDRLPDLRVLPGHWSQ